MVIFCRPILIFFLIFRLDRRRGEGGLRAGEGGRDAGRGPRLQVNTFPVWLRNRLISAGLEPVLSHTEKSSIVHCFYPYTKVTGCLSVCLSVSVPKDLANR